MSKKPTPKEFIKAWQASDSVKEVAKKLGMNAKTIRSRATYYKKKGIPLKRYSGGRSVDWDELAKYARECLEEQGDSHDQTS